jgi:hypothetical protein
MFTAAVLLTLTAPFAGVMDKAVNRPGPTGVALLPVVKALVNATAGFPCGSVKPPTQTLYVVVMLRGTEGTKVSVIESLARVAVPETGVGELQAVVDTMMAFEATVLGSTTALITATT